MMDTYTQAITAKRHYRGIEEKRRIVEETLAEGATSVALVARAHGVNANLVFNWRRLYQAGRLCGRGEAKLLPVKVTPESSLPLTTTSASLGSSPSAIHIQLRHAQVHIEGNADPVMLRILLECLQR
jgi:transposase